MPHRPGLVEKLMVGGLIGTKVFYNSTAKNRPDSASSVEAESGLLVFSRALPPQKAQELRESNL
jgi:hypothetical protein